MLGSRERSVKRSFDAPRQLIPASESSRTGPGRSLEFPGCERHHVCWAPIHQCRARGLIHSPRRCDLPKALVHSAPVLHGMEHASARGVMTHQAELTRRTDGLNDTAGSQSWHSAAAPHTLHIYQIPPSACCCCYPYGTYPRTRRRAARRLQMCHSQTSSPIRSLSAPPWLRRDITTRRGTFNTPPSPVSL